MSKRSKSAGRSTQTRHGADGGIRRAKKRAPRSQVLPGMEQVRSQKLDNVSEAISECRSKKNAAVLEEKGLVTAALQAMVQRGIAVYRHGGVELSRIPGAEKLRVRITAEEGDADAEDLEQSPAAEGEIRAGVKDDFGVGN